MKSVKNLETGMIEKWDIKRILQEINRDRSEEWMDYDENDWIEGWNEWVEGDIYSIVHD